MIIQRKYATYGQLYSDNETKEAITRIFQKYNVSERVYEYILDPANDIIVNNTDMGSGIPGEAYQELRKTIEELDETYPFDNKLTYRDVNEVLSFPSRKGSAVMQIMYKKSADCSPVIVQVVAMEYKDGKTSIIEPWDTGTIIL